MPCSALALHPGHCRRKFDKSHHQLGGVFPPIPHQQRTMGGLRFELL